MWISRSAPVWLSFKVTLHTKATLLSKRTKVILKTKPTSQKGKPELDEGGGKDGSTRHTQLQADGSFSEDVRPLAQNPTTNAAAPTELVSTSMAQVNSPKELEDKDGRQNSQLRSKNRTRTCKQRQYLYILYIHII